MEIALFRENESISFAPIRDNKALNDDQFTQLPQPEREIFHKHVEELEEYLSDVLLELPQWRREMVEKIKQLDNDTISLAIEPLFAELNDSYQNIDDVITYLAEIKKSLMQHHCRLPDAEPDAGAARQHRKTVVADRAVRAQYSGR